MMKPYEWMVEYTSPTNWVEEKGILVYLAEVSGAVGGGLYLSSLHFDSLWGTFISWLLLILKGGFHFAHLGQPSRFWRLALKPRTSWLARGFIFLTLFLVFGALQLCFSLWLPGSTWELVFKVVAGLTAVLVAAYTGFVMNYIIGIPFWNSALLPLLFVLFGGLGGLAVLLVIGILGGSIDMLAAMAGIRWLLIINAFLIVLHSWSAMYMGPTGRRSVIELTKGRIAPILWIGVVLLGILIPFSIALHSSLVDSASSVLLIIAVVCILVGVLSFNYCLLRGGLYSPLVPRS